MSIIIRLQNLPLSANSLDIRRFFSGLQIPDGGVHIVGGENGDAFIAFTSDEDARQAMQRNGDLIKDCRISLLLSSRNEMQRVIDMARNQTLAIKSLDTSSSLSHSLTHSHSTHSTHTHVSPSKQTTNMSNMSNSVYNMTTSTQSNQIKSVNDIRLRSRSPEKRQRLTRDRERERRSIERERDINLNRNRLEVEMSRSRSRSPVFNKNDFNGNSMLIDRMSRIDSSMSSAYNSMPSSMRSRLGYADAIPPINAIQVEDHIASRNQWPSQTNDNIAAFQGLPPHGELIPGSGDFDRDLELYRDNRGLRSGAPLSQRQYTVELRNLPFNIVVRDICEFFTPLYIREENVKILIDDRGLTTGGALVRFSNERDFDAALSMNNRFLGERRIDVQPLLDTPYALTEHNDPINYGSHQPSHPPSHQPPHQSPHPPSHDSLGPLQSLGHGGPPPRRTSGARVRDREREREYVLYMKGLPYSNCTERDVQKFFEPIRVKDIVIETDPKGKPTGNAFVEFDSSRDYDSGMQLNMKHMGRRYIELIPTSKDEMIDVRERMRIGNDIGQPLTAPKITYCVNVNGLPATVTNRDLTHYFSECGAQPYAIHIMLRPNGLNAGEAYVEFISLDYQYLSLARDGDFIGNSRINVKPVPFEVMKSIVGKPPLQPPIDHPNGRNGSSRRGAHDEHFRKREREDKRRVVAVDPFADGGCVVIATNIPYRASTEDICVFFSDFGITEGCISRRFNEKGQPTADANIAFHNREDAIRAVRLMHKKFLIGRPVFLKHAV